MRHTIHPTREKLIAFIDGRLDEPETGKLSSHLEDCEFCREFIDDYRLLQQSLATAEQEVLPGAVEELTRRLYRESLLGCVVSLEPLRVDSDEQTMPLAADRKPEEPLSSDSGITLYSEDPEIILRLMSGPRPDDNYVQLISDDSELVAHVLVQAPQLGREFLTDARGRADLGAAPLELTDDIKWQIKMPDAVFDLEPLVYDPDKPEHSEQVTLETDRQDKLEVTFERLTEGKRITLRLIELDGKTDFGEVKVVVATEHASHLDQMGIGSSATFVLDDAEATVNIRLFTK